MTVLDWFEYPTNFSNGSGINGVADAFVSYPNSVLGGWLGPGILTLMWIVLFSFGLSSGSKKATLVASFICSLFSIFFWRLNIITPVVVAIFLVLTIISAILTSQDSGL